MTPSFSSFNATNGVLLNAVVGCNFALQSIIGKDCVNLRFGQFGRRTTLATIGGAMLNTIQLIVARGIPSQVFKAIVPRIAVVVTALHALWPRPDKSSQHKRMRAHNLLFSCFPQIHERARIVNVARIRFNFLRFCRTNLSKIRNFVQAFKSNDRFPVFHVDPHSATIGMIA